MTANKNYQALSYLELKELQARAESWLRANERHPRYEEALIRYEKIMDSLQVILKEELPF